MNKAQDLEAEMMGIAYTAGDLTISYSEQSLTTRKASAAAVESELEAIQAAYTMGAMTISASIAETSNAAATAGNQLDHNELQVSFAF